MALADLVLEGLTLILAIALGLVLIGGLAYLTITVSTVNNARLAYAGLYIYLPQPIYVNGTLYVPMYNIGYYRAIVKYVYVRGVDGSMHVYAPNLVLGVNQYYVYTLSLSYEPASITVLASPVGYPGIIKEFSANVSTVTSIPLIPQAQLQPGSGLINVVVNDPFGAGWRVVWSYAGQSYSVSESQSYSWFINPPYVPIQIQFLAYITNTPHGYTCQIVPSQVAKTYTAGSIQAFNVTCSVMPITVSVDDPYGAGWSVSWSGGASGSKSGSSSASWTVSALSTVNFQASITSVPSGYSSCSISPTSTSAGPGQSVAFTVSCTGNQSPSPPPGGGGSSYTVTVYVYAPSGVSWTVYLDQYIAGSTIDIDWWSGAGNGGPYTATVSGGLTYLFTVKNLPSGCTASGSPYGIGQTFTPKGSFTEQITITCTNKPPPPPPPPPSNNQQCTYSYSSSISASGVHGSIQQSVSCSGPSSEPVGSGQVGMYGCTAPLTITDTSGDEFQFQSWSVSVSPSGYAWSGTTDLSEFGAPLYCPSPASVSISGTASYTFLKCTSYTVKFTYYTSSSATFEWSFCPDDPANSWSATGKIYQGTGIQVTAKVYANFGSGSASFTIDNVCQYGVQSVNTNPSGGSASGFTGSASFNIIVVCQSSGGKGKQ
ncbi:hypothetical protein [Vulcanisaeta distributa]|nr:hypothetical protein [Vulcanisaeta distributa]